MVPPGHTSPSGLARLKTVCTYVCMFVCIHFISKAPYQIKHTLQDRYILQQCQTRKMGFLAQQGNSLELLYSLLKLSVLDHIKELFSVSGLFISPNSAKSISVNTDLKIQIHFMSPKLRMCPTRPPQFQILLDLCATGN